MNETKTQTRSGRQVEDTTRTEFNHRHQYNGYTIVGVSNNVRRYDGEITQDNYWAVTDQGGHLYIDRGTYGDLRIADRMADAVLNETSLRAAAANAAREFVNGRIDADAFETILLDIDVTAPTAIRFYEEDRAADLRDEFSWAGSV